MSHLRSRYFAVFFVVRNGIRWELACTPRIAMPWDVLRALKEARNLRMQHPEWKHHPAKEMLRQLPFRKRT